MAEWLRRIFSATYRRGLSAEAAADYVAAAEAYALAGLPEKVAEMHLVRAGRVEPSERMAALEDALRWLAKADEARLPASLRPGLAAALSGEASELPAGDPRKARLLSAAAKLYEAAGSLREAGKAHEAAGDSAEASRCYEAAGAIEDMERLLEADSAARALRDEGACLFEEYEAAMASGARDEARAALRRCIGQSPGKGYERLLAELEQKLPRPGAVQLVVDGARILVVGRTPAIVGRGDADVALRHPGVSRHHAAIDADGQGFALRDAGSRNGTMLAGLPIAGTVRLEGSGTIGLGDESSLEFAVREDVLELKVLDGPDRGLRAIVTRGSCVPSPGAPFRIGFRSEMATVEDADGAELALNGVRVAGAIVVLVGDVIEAPAGGRIEVLG